MISRDKHATKLYQPDNKLRLKLSRWDYAQCEVMHGCQTRLCTSLSQFGRLAAVQQI